MPILHALLRPVSAVRAHLDAVDADARARGHVVTHGPRGLRLYRDQRWDTLRSGSDQRVSGDRGAA
jgi:hypothetical protein